MSRYTSDAPFPKRPVAMIVSGVIALLALTLVVGSFETVKAGQRGIRVRFGEVQPESLEEGLHFKWPLIEEIVQIDCREKIVSITTDAASKDLQKVRTDVVVNYAPQPRYVWAMYKFIGSEPDDWARVVFQPTVQESVKQITATYTAAELIQLRTEVKEKIENAIRERVRAADDTFFVTVLADDGSISERMVLGVEESFFTEVRISITDFSFSATYDAAIEAKEVALQRAEQAKHELERKKTEYQQLVEEAKQLAQAEIERADGEAQAVERRAVAEADRIRVIAAAEAEALKLLAEAADDRALRVRFIEKWDGVLPRFMTGDDSPLRFLVPTGGD